MKFIYIPPMVNGGNRPNDDLDPLGVRVFSCFVGRKRLSDANVLFCFPFMSCLSNIKSGFPDANLE